MHDMQFAIAIGARARWPGLEQNAAGALGLAIGLRRARPARALNSTADHERTSGLPMMREVLP